MKSKRPPSRRPGRPRRAVGRLRDLRRRGEASPGKFPLLFQAIQEASESPGPMAREVQRSSDLHVAFRLDGGGPLACIEVRRGRVKTHPDPEPDAVQVTLPAATAARILTAHPAKALIEAYMNGAAKVEGETAQFMALVSLLEGLVPHLEPGGRR